ncbi:hypothetical protein A3D42_02490 [Candidatus Nomurabacteria bacterium RIFCSPHIGHO2_02_FULL_41_18]|uniref:Uncharacterized protein n=1 Tax=Candidatus Nomurabacteria bacterium RIFCSPHIGHO2_02_FULL_41_18 TaxID=1801754 RepID=A0A1F6W4Z5_9BACT|nr:MAG: hypothetical protein A2737_02075 [Candidatus Nomurabacteria bacterium RIFCSPHIGHO2_01_FULL_41_71]OGI76979.1 MAG: hypothetical protein A3D42_02490 [Candidatus Nomurabacteria bacterium RIFCSPHIGHO2_02_FULL_41_18]OGI89489.1 MAG: hypothetical protein A3B01_01195 [Candidatus Nomurabacteria bacterium RIFCSPLOWO2_01_FULL_41_52b]OGJ00063.1 MAG: hypothetical protein A3I90_02855 [Candidatus Nomurabacteria bacterium RIFCSPLOWO2_02_FULL_41_9]
MRVKILSTRGKMGLDMVLAITTFCLGKVIVINDMSKPFLDIFDGEDEDIQKLAEKGIMVEKA